MITLSFYSFLRPGEVTRSPNNIGFQQVQVQQDNLCITFLQIKHYQGHPVTIVVNSQHSSPCPVKSVREYISIRGDSKGSLFCHPNLSPITYSEYSQMFSNIQSFLTSKDTYHLHGLRIGAATYAAIKGIPEETIKRMGRWHSNAFTKYIRISSFNV